MLNTSSSPEWFKSWFSLILSERLTTKTNPEIETSAQNMETSESAFFTHFPSQILATQPDSQYLGSYREDEIVCLTL